MVREAIQVNPRNESVTQIACDPKAQMNGLSFLWLEITGKCNLECIHCYTESNKHVHLYGLMQRSNWLKVIDEAINSGCHSIQFIGGEPTLHPSLNEFICYAYERGVTFVEVYTNATSLTKERLRFFKEYGVSIATSFYSKHREVHERITRGGGSFDRTVAGIESVLEEGVPLRVGLISMDAINEDGQREAADFLKSLGVTNIGYDRLREVGRGLIGRTIDDPCESLCGQCWKSRLCITPNGDAYPCVFSRKFRVGNVLDAPLSEIITDSALVETREHLREQLLHLEAQPCGPQCSPGCSPACGPTCNPWNCNPSCSPGAPTPWCNPTSRDVNPI